MFRIFYFRCEDSVKPRDVRASGARQIPDL
nr:MAG TPA: hypothetical protein [Caudoviricetes sp.]